MKKHLKGSAVLICCLLFTLLFSVGASALSLGGGMIFKSYSEYVDFVSNTGQGDSFVYYETFKPMGEKLIGLSLYKYGTASDIHGSQAGEEMTFYVLPSVPDTSYADMSLYELSDGNGGSLYISSFYSDTVNEFLGDRTPLEAIPKDIRTSPTVGDRTSVSINGVEYCYDVDGRLKHIAWEAYGLNHIITGELSSYPLEGKGFISRMLAEPSGADLLLAALDYDATPNITLYRILNIGFYAAVVIVPVCIIAALTVVFVPQLIKRKNRSNKISKKT